VRYFNGSTPLAGSINGAQNMSALLGQRGFSTEAEAMRLLRDDASLDARMHGSNLRRLLGHGG
jgi:hypothetical protein